MSEPRVRTRMEGRVAVVELDDGKVNAMQGQLLGQLDAALDEALAAGARALLIAGRPGCFSAGLDVKTLPGLPAPELRATLQQFTDVMLRIFTLDRPVVAAITGHAIAGGAVLALAADRRIMADAPFRIGLNEVPLGIAVPRFVVDFARLVLPLRRHLPAIAHGELSTGRDALDHGWVEALVDPPDQTVARALELATALARLSPTAYAHTKRLLRDDAIAPAREVLASELDTFTKTFRPGG